MSAPYRAAGPAAFDLAATSSAGGAFAARIFGLPCRLYANANLSLVLRQRCNARCPFCVEELRPASRGLAWDRQRALQADDGAWLGGLDATLAELTPLVRSVSITGGEPSRDPLLPVVLARVGPLRQLRRTMTSNASGLQDVVAGRRQIDHVVAAGLDHLNLSRAHDDADRNARLMAMADGLSDAALADVCATAARGGVAVRLSCVLLADGVATRDDVERYLDFAADMGVARVIFRELMQEDPAAARGGGVVRYCARQRVPMRPLLAALDGDARYRPLRQVVGYYYYVEVFETMRAGRPMRVAFEAADLAWIARQRQAAPGLVHELIFHPSGRLSSSWTEEDGCGFPPS